MKIQINEKQLSAHATQIHAEMLIAELAAIGWPAVYVPADTPACWDFDGERYILNAFEIDFELISEELWPGDYSWEVIPENRFPVTAFNDHDKAPGKFI